jgi:hypothetical protein
VTRLFDSIKKKFPKWLSDLFQFHPTDVEILTQAYSKNVDQTLKKLAAELERAERKKIRRQKAKLRRRSASYISPYF